MDSIDKIRAELLRANKKFPPFNSGHEGYAVLLEEVEELKENVFWSGGDLDAMEEEAAQVGAMAAKLMDWIAAQRDKTKRAKLLEVCEVPKT